jgi:N-acyl-L-homoserine lactone synthetase
VLEGQLLERERRALATRQQVVPACVGVGVEVGHDDRRLERADLGLQRAHHVHAVEVPAVVAVAVDCDQHLRLDLREAVDHRARAEVR